MNTILIEATITTVAPLSIAMPVAEGQQENEWKNFPVTAVGLDDAGQLRRTGYLPASTVRGFLRRAVSMAAMQARGPGNTTMQQAYSDILGQAGDGKEEVDLLQMSKEREADPILDLFGRWSFKSRLLVSNFMPAVPVLPEPITGTRKDLEDTEGVLEALTDGDRAAYFGRSDANADRAAAEALVSGIKAKLRKAKKAGTDAADLEAALAEAEAKAASAKAAMGDMQNSSRTITTFYALPSGLALSGKLVVERARERDLDLLLVGLDALSRRPLLGAQVARGCGEVGGRFVVRVDGALHSIVTTQGWQAMQVERF
ncbi:hypothetical protein NYO99_15820 [Pelomonas sp. UHG3]|uniref:Uncharacterized protein n=1 Tax=Roseateles hydrophilus TaxID=2975054 RepID=A0ACC6CDF8_9BURK|nr:hypothetical protein [Pelomonas sp. UHG3]MCY4746451.1 hypothetical protein [Pelomonas sp. UHG3]